MIVSDKAAEYWDSEWAKRTDGDVLVFNEQKRRHISNYLKLFDIGDGSILDIGCGIGQFNIEFGWKNYTGIDLSPHAIQYGLSMRQDSKYICGNVLNLPENEKYDWFMAWDSLEHMNLDGDLAAKIDSLSHKKSVFLGNVPTAFFSEAGEFEHEMNYDILKRFLINCGYLMINTSTFYTKGVRTIKYQNGSKEKKKCLYPFLLFNAHRIT